jgi:uncharacterized protein DUF4380
VDDAPEAAPLDGASSSSSDGPTADAAVNDATVNDATADDTTAGDAMADDTMADSTTADDATADDTTAGDAMADSTMADNTTADDAMADDATADQATADDATADQATADGGTANDEGASDGGGVDAAANDAAGPSPVVPTLQNGDYVFASGDLSLAVDPQVGGRVVSFALAAQNALTGTDANATNYGSTFWTSPQSDWNWPPPPEIDNQPYTASVDGGELTLQGAANPALGVKITKVFSLDPASGSVSIRYTIENAGTSPRSLAPWEVTRVQPSGMMFFPTGATASSADSGPPLATQQASGATWFDYDAAVITGNIKYFADGLRGWLAQENGGVLFVKKFADVPLDAQAPGEAEIEIFVSGDRAYVELENQGAYTPLAAGTSLAWTVRWYLVKLPASVDASVGSASLVSFVDGLQP